MCYAFITATITWERSIVEVKFIVQYNISYTKNKNLYMKNITIILFITFIRKVLIFR